MHTLRRFTPSLLTLLMTLNTLSCERRTTAARTHEEGRAEQQPAAPRSQGLPVASQAPPVTPPVPVLSSGARLEDERNTIEVFRSAAPATVFVTQKRLVRDLAMRALEVPAGSGTGFVWDQQGHIVTNFHVIDTRGDPRTTYTVTLYNQASYEARLVGGEPKKDIAVLKIDAPAKSLTRIRPLGPDIKIEVGQKAIAIGNPFGLDHTLTTGVISAINREVEGYGGVTIRDMIQTDASINPGNSGGPLLDSSGQVIGMNTMIFSKTGSSAGIGFAVPVSVIRRLVPQIIQFGRPKQAGLGVRLLSDEVAARAGVRGVIIAEVVNGSSADEAGLRGLQRSPMGSIMLGDVIVGVDDQKVDDYDDLYNALDGREPGQDVTVKVRRDGQVVMIKMKLMELQ